MTIIITPTQKSQFLRLRICRCGEGDQFEFGWVVSASYGGGSCADARGGMEGEDDCFEAAGC